ncbi:hypothetical protein L2D14_12385 [Thalassospiraceae bacterium LMO-JJ14]|nr:hypothetical protein L2D14_12385 [Thalassospiraceae bacterium LMO-JJ14]
MNKVLWVPALIVMMMSAAACSGVAPYVHEPYTINRNLETFPDGPEITVGSEVNICYAKSKATPSQIRALAEEYCARAGLGAQFVGHTYDLCPLLAPTTAVFNCQTAVAGSNATQASRPPTPAGIAAPAFEAPKPAGAGRSFGTLGAADVSTTAKSQPFPTYLFNNGQPAR